MKLPRTVTLARSPHPRTGSRPAGTIVPADRYYNSMLTGTDRSIVNCGDVYDRLRGYNIFVVRSCGNGVDASCNKRIKSTNDDGVDVVRQRFNTVINHLGLTMNYAVNTRNSCIF